MESKIKKKLTKFRVPISPEERLAVTLRHLATGESQQSISFSFPIGRTTVNNIITETCKAIWDVFCPLYLKHPTCPEECLHIPNEFETLWNFPNCVGAIDGKHIAIECPRNSGSLFYNYKGFFSMVLLAVCDAKYCFYLVDIGQYGSGNGSSVSFNDPSFTGDHNERTTMLCIFNRPGNLCNLWVFISQNFHAQIICFG